MGFLSNFDFSNNISDTNIFSTRGVPGGNTQKQAEKGSQQEDPDMSEEEIIRKIDEIGETAEKIFKASERLVTVFQKEVRKAFLMGVLSTMLGILVGGLLGYSAFYRISPSPYPERSLLGSGSPGHP